MFAKSREKVKSTPFSEFVRNSSAREKRKFFNKVIKDTVAEQRAVIQASKVLCKQLKTKLFKAVLHGQTQNGFFDLIETQRRSVI